LVTRIDVVAIHSVLHLPPGSSYESAHVKPQPTFRIFLLGARAESTLPPHLWQQLTYLFPRNNFNIYFIGPEVGLPLFDQSSPRRKKNYAFSEEGGWGHPSYQVSINPQLILTSIKAPYEEIHPQLGPFDPYTDVFFAFSPGLGFPHQGPTGQPANVAPQAEEGQVTLDRAEAVPGGGSGATAAGAANAYSPPEVEETKPVDSTSTPSQPLVQAQTSWRKPLQQILQTKCGLFFTAFSPLDLQRDVAALSGTPPPVAAPSGPREFPDYVNLPTRAVPHIDGVTDEFELVLTPGRNPFGSEKWEIAEWDVRVGVKTNWGVWGIRGKRYDVVEGQE
jgi:splicing suppressor protein 51